MKLHLADSKNRYAVTGYGAGYLAVNGVRYEQALIICPDQPPLPWEVASFEGLDAERFAGLLKMRPEIIVLGTGARQQFPAPALLRPLIEAGTGLETMGTAAACRTYNILMGEGRRVIAAMLLP